MENRKAAIKWFSMLKEKFAKTEYEGYLDMAISALEKQEQDRWHSVAKEGNPKEEGLYIITKKLRNRNGMEMYKVAVDRWSQDGLGKEWSYNSNVFVSAWRPLPEPYTEEEA